MSTWAQPGRLRRPGRGLKTVEKSANGQFSKPPHTQKFGHPLASGTTVVSDGAPSFNYAAWNQLAKHEPIVTGSGKQACEIPQLRAVNTVLGNLKTAIAGTYHAFKFAKYADRYLGDYQFRFNRRFDMAKLMHSIIRAVLASKPTPLAVLRMAEDRR